MARNKLHPIPHPPRTPVLGNMLTVDGDAPIQDLMRIAREQGPIFWLDMMGTPLVVVSGADLVAELCDEKRFDKAVRGSLRRVRMLGGDALFTAETQEPNWQKAHNILLPTFAHRMMQTYHEGMLDIAEQLVTKWERLNADEEIDVVRDMTALTLDTIGLCGFNYRFNSFYRSDNHPYVELLVRALEAVMKMRGLPLEDITQRKSRKKLEQDVGFMNGIADRIIRERREIPADDQSKPDLLGFMLTGLDKQSGERLDDVNIRYQMNTFLIAGHETTSGMLSFAIYFLLNNPHVIQKAYEEVDRVLGRDINARPSAQQVNQLVYIGQILKEALRLWPTAPAFGLYPYQNETIGGKYKLRKRTFVTVLTAMLHRDQSVWGPRAEVFDPENFAPEREAKMPTHAFKPFGNGQRACIGRQFAMTEATLVLGLILQRFRLVDHTRYQLKIKESLTIKPEGLTMRVRLRPDVVRGSGVSVAVKPAAKQTAAKKAARSHGTKLTVLFGSNMGTAEELARSIAEAGETQGFAATLAALDDQAGKLPTDGAVAIVCASYNGGPPDNAGAFLKSLREAAPGSLAGVRFTVFGCGNRDWASTYQAIPRQIDELLAAKGAERLYARGEGDAKEDLDGHFQAWNEPLLPALADKLGVKLEADSGAANEPLYQIQTVDKPPANPIIGGVGALPMRVLVNRELQNADSSGRSTRHIEVLLPDGVAYRAGDHLSIVPQNAAALVERAVRRFGFAPGAHVMLAAAEGRRANLPVGEAVAVHRLLSDFVELQHPATRKQIQTMAQHTRCPFTRPKLEALLDAERFRGEVLANTESVLDLLEEHPACELPFAAFLEMLPLMTPRYYSISSSPMADGNRCSITVAVVEGPARSGTGVYYGVCSNHLLRQAAGGTVQAFVKETKVGFRLPVDPAVPIVMIGPGTGLAPFRGFLRERAALKAQGRSLGPAMLFFGCRHPEQDFIYEKELREQADAGVVDLHVAFSRNDGKKTYVQDLLKAEADRVRGLIDRGGIVYVCGDGGRMEPDVKRALAAMYDEAFVSGLAADNRYVLDVWASKATRAPGRDRERARALSRIKLAATALLVFTAALFIVARHFEPTHWAWGYVAAFAAAATVGGLADWYAVVALFRRPLGLPIPHTAIVPRNHLRIADTLGEFIETNFLAPEPVEARLREVDFAALVAEWLSDRERSAALADFSLKLLPQSLGAIEQSGLKDFLGKRIMTELERVELAPLAAGLLSAVTEKGRHQRLLDELLGALEKVLTNEETLAALRDKIRQELPALFNLYRADAYLLRKIVASTGAFIQDARTDAGHPLRREFDSFVTGFIEQLRSSQAFARRAEGLKRDLLARPEITTLAEGAWESLRSFLEQDSRATDSQVRRQLEAMLVEIGRQLARDPAIRSEINRGMVRVLGDFVQNQKSGVGRFIADQVKSWDIDMLIGRIELTVGRDLQYIRFNGAMIGGLAGLALHAMEQGLKLAL